MASGVSQCRELREPEIIAETKEEMRNDVMGVERSNRRSDGIA